MSDEELMPSRRSSRSRSKNNANAQVLERLRNLRKEGKSHRENVENTEVSLFEEIDDEEYLDRYGDDDFVEDDDGGGYAETGRDVFDEEQDFDEVKKKKEKKPKQKRGALDSYLTFQPKIVAKEEAPSDQFDADLDAMLAAVDACDGSSLLQAKPELVEDEVPFQSSNKFKRNVSPVFLNPKPVKLRRKENSIASKKVEKPKIEQEDDGPGEYMDFDDDVPDYRPPVSPIQPFSPAKKDVVDSKSVVSPEIEEEDVVVQPLSMLDELQNLTDIQIEEFKENESLAVATGGNLMEYLVQEEDGSNTLQFFWIDAFEEAKHPDRVYLFGFIKTGLSNYESCCVIVENIQRRLYFIKKENVEKIDMVYAEVENLLMTRGKISPFCVRRRTNLNFAFMDGETPEQAECLEVIFNGKAPIPELKSGATFSRVANTTVTALERFLVERDIRGPCWLKIGDVKTVESAKASYSKHEFRVVVDDKRPSMDIVAVLQAEHEFMPFGKMMAINVVTVAGKKDQKPEIVMINVMRSTKFYFDRRTPMNWEKVNCFLTTPVTGSIPYQFQNEAAGRNVEKFPNEYALLSRFLAELKSFDPDVIIAHDLTAQLQILRDRIEEKNLGASAWSSLGRLKRTGLLKQMPSNKQFRWTLTAGRLLLDSKLAATELLHCQSYDLGDLVNQVVAPVVPNAKRINVDDEWISSVFFNNTGKTDDLFKLINWSFHEAQFSVQVLAQLDAMPLFLQITEIVGGILSRTLMGGRAERNEYLLLHAFYKNKFVAPDKVTPKFGKFAKHDVKKDAGEGADVPQTSSKKSQYTGGLVLEPKRGLYETYIVLVDFNSLYPSIIQQFNICFTTVKLQQRDKADEEALPEMPDASCAKGILPREIEKLVDNRKEVKRQMKSIKNKNSEDYKQKDIRQLGLKLTANSMYGCLGFEGSRFCAKALAAMITMKGRQILEATKDMVESNGYPVIYGDTDSIMVNTNSTDLAEAIKIGNRILGMVNGKYEHIKMDMDGLYKKLLLLKKKKYAGLAVDLSNENKEKREMKGLDIVRRDWSVLAKEVGEKVVDMILLSKSRDEMIEEIRIILKQIKDLVGGHKLLLGKYEILKKLTHRPEDYKDTKAQPHVQVALRLNQTRNANLHQNDIVKYIICDDGTTNPNTQRAYAKIEIESDSKLKVDGNYYLAHQVHPIVSRLCEPIEEMDSCQVAEALGLDPTGYKRRLRDQVDDLNEDDVDPGFEAEFNACDGLTFKCPACSKLRIIRSIVDEEGRLSLSDCPDCKFNLIEAALSVECQISEHIHKSYKQFKSGHYTCDDITCDYFQDFKPLIKNEFGNVCPKCDIGFLKKEYTARKLYVQQKFWLTLVDLDKYLKNEATIEQKKTIDANEKLKKYYGVWAQRVNEAISLNAYSKVDLSVVFRAMTF